MSAERHEDPAPEERQDAGDAALRGALAQNIRDGYLRALAEPKGLLKMSVRRIDMGVYFIALGFNLREDRDCPYTFPEDVRLRADKLLSELCLLWKDNKKGIRICTGALAGKDPGFQRFMAAAASAAPPGQTSAWEQKDTERRTRQSRAARAAWARRRAKGGP